jgi:hypothetical protein
MRLTARGDGGGGVRERKSARAEVGENSFKQAHQRLS